MSVERQLFPSGPRDAPLLRLLLAQDGSTTRGCEAVTGQPVQVVLHHQVRTTDVPSDVHAHLGGERWLERVTTLVVDGQVMMDNLSFTRLDAVPDWFLQGLDAGAAPIGHLLDRLFVRRERVDTDAALQEHLWRHVGQPDAAASRSYRVVTVNLFGHGHPTIVEAMKRQLEQLSHVMLAGCTHAPVVELSERLGALTGLGHAFYASDGASAIEIALKMSAHYWRNVGRPEKSRFIGLQDGYHGETVGALSVTDIPLFREAYGPLVRVSATVPSPDARRAAPGVSPAEHALHCAAALESWLQVHHAETAALVLEPLVQCAIRCTCSAHARCAIATRCTWWPTRSPSVSGAPAACSPTSRPVSGRISSACPRG